ncbi:MAG: HU family DNA-binding protein [Campylobacterales bacterium]
MKKSELIKDVARKTGWNQKDVKVLIDTLCDTVKEELKKGNKVNFIGFGVFEPVERKGRETKLPKTNKVIKIPSSKSVKFRLSKRFKAYLNETEKSQKGKE